MRGIRDGPVHKHQLRIEQHTDLLHHPLTEHGKAHIPDCTRQVAPQPCRTNKQRRATDQEHQHPDAFRSSHGDCCAVDAQVWKPPSSVNQGIGQQDVQNIDSDHGVHGSARVSGAVQDARQNLDDNRKGDDTKDDIQVRPGQCDHVWGCSQQLHRGPIDQDSKRHERQRNDQGKRKYMHSRLAGVGEPSGSPKLCNHDRRAHREAGDDRDREEHQQLSDAYSGDRRRSQAADQKNVQNAFGPLQETAHGHG